MRTNSNQIIAAGNMASNITSTIMFIDQIGIVSLVAAWTGTPTGSIKIQVSNDSGQVPSGGGVVNWADLSDSMVPVNGAGSFSWNYPLLGYRWMQVLYSATSGTGSLTVTQNVKG